MPYVLTNGDGEYIRYSKGSGKYVKVRNAKEAMLIETEQKANNILRSSLKKEYQLSFHIEERKEVQSQNTNGPAEDVTKSIGDLLSSIQNSVCGLEHRQEELSNALSNVDKEISDIYHYIEFNNLSASHGFLIYKKLQGRLRERRKIKNEMEVLSCLRSCNLTSVSLEKVKHCIDNLDNKTYAPRVLTELFE